jgi:hypothetical protein
VRHEIIGEDGQMVEIVELPGPLAVESQRQVGILPVPSQNW